MRRSETIIVPNTSRLANFAAKMEPPEAARINALTYQRSKSSMNMQAPVGSTPRVATKISTERLVVEQVPKFATQRHSSIEFSEPLSSVRTSRPAANSDVKGLSVGRMILMSNGEKTKNVENRIQDRYDAMQMQICCCFFFTVKNV